MNRVRWVVFCLALLLAGLVAIGSPHSAAAGLDEARLYGYQDSSEGTQPTDRPMLSVPGVFSLWIGKGFSSQDGTLRLESAQVDLPAINATATINGFTFGLQDRSYGWDNITLMQAAPMQSTAVTIADTQVSVQGPSANYSAELSTRVDVHPSEDVQVGATITLGYDGLAGQPTFSVADGEAQVTAGPATVAVKGLNAGEDAVAVEAAQVVFPDARIGVRLDGFSTASGQPDWQALTWYGQEFKLGDVATLSDNLIVVPGPSAAAATPIGATTSFAINGGDLAAIDGQLIFTVDPTTKQPSLSLVNGSAVLGVSAWNLALEGINAGKGGATVDSVMLTAEPLSIQAQVSGLAVGGANGFTFDQARLLYLPDPAAAQQPVAGFELVIDSTEAGYIVTTTTILPTASAKAP